MGTWAEKFVDQQVDRAWRAMRLDLADRFEDGLERGQMLPIDITTPAGQTLSVELVHGEVVVMAGDDFTATTNVDEAAYAVVSILQERWRVVHPVFLDSEVVDVPRVDDNPVETRVPVAGRAESREQLQAWVEATFRRGRTEALKVSPDGSVHWRTPGGHRVTVQVKNATRIELRSVIAREVGFKKARSVIDELSRQCFGLKFFLVRDNIVVSQIVIARPYHGDQLTHALSCFAKDIDALGWVSGKVLRKRVKQRRAQEVPPGLLALLPSANRVSTAVLADQVAAAAGSSVTLHEWREVCRREWRKARLLPRDADDPQRVNHRLRMGWSRLGRAIDVAVGDDTGRVEGVA